MSKSARSQESSEDSRARYTRALDVVIRSPRLTKADKALYVTLRTFCFNNQTKCDPPKSVLAWLLGISEREVHDCLQRLEREGVLKKTNRSDKNQTNQYEFMAALPDKLCPPERLGVSWREMMVLAHEAAKARPRRIRVGHSSRPAADAAGKEPLPPATGSAPPATGSAPPATGCMPTGNGLQDPMQPAAAIDVALFVDPSVALPVQGSACAEPPRLTRSALAHARGSARKAPPSETKVTEGNGVSGSPSYPRVSAALGSAAERKLTDENESPTTPPRHATPPSTSPHEDRAPTKEAAFGATTAEGCTTRESDAFGVEATSEVPEQPYQVFLHFKRAVQRRWPHAFVPEPTKADLGILKGMIKRYGRGGLFEVIQILVLDWESIKQAGEEFWPAATGLPQLEQLIRYSKSLAGHVGQGVISGAARESAYILDYKRRHPHDNSMMANPFKVGRERHRRDLEDEK